jgi:hypothetical protein
VTAWTVTEAGALQLDEVLDLYSWVGWTAYTRTPDVLERALADD